MQALNLNILGFQAVNKDLRVEIRDVQTNQVVREAKPFLDGTLSVGKINPGAYELTIKHPNLSLPVVRRPIRVLPNGPTRVSVVIDPAMFRNTPIEDIPDADLSPVRQVAESVADSMAGLAGKRAGELIKVEDWNAMAAGLADLARAISELTRLVAPQGHNHPELERKFDEVTGNFRMAIEILNATLAELQRQIQSLRFRRTVADVLDRAAIDPTSGEGRQMLDLVERLERDVSKTPREFARTAREVGVELDTQLNVIIDRQADDTTFIETPAVQELGQAVTILQKFDTMSYDSELAYFRQTDKILGGAGRKAFR